MFLDKAIQSGRIADTSWRAVNLGAWRMRLSRGSLATIQNGANRRLVDLASASANAAASIRPSARLTPVQATSEHEISDRMDDGGIRSHGGDPDQHHSR